MIKCKLNIKLWRPTFLYHYLINNLSIVLLATLPCYKNVCVWQDGKEAASLTVAEQYVEAFHNLAKTNNTLILPSNVGDISSAVAHVSLLLKYLICTNTV